MPVSDSQPLINRIDSPAIGGLNVGSAQQVRRIAAAVAKSKKSPAATSPIESTSTGAPTNAPASLGGPRPVGSQAVGSAAVRTDGSGAGASIRVDGGHRVASADSLSGRAAHDRTDWLQLHAAELIRRLQTWANGLDAREASLNAAMARQDLRERQFRLQQLEWQAEMDAAKIAADQLRDNLSAQSRRLAFQSLA
ncbi:hypothetical protein [Planctomycetes bacterium K23_9]|uniref:Uncharacterized protein n=1 Tax=Stieleria marina TaxID=1930275 RepID=A0A517P0F0_9BACT|nr:hypothetical protein K239x_48690 [Planctomycetes bacterium K23_9]